ncbi:hypothetical protein [Nakamurella sp.]|uniref:hypothetical protein n=1 Tax=Nakamurella sp. TaxID=1869182 RepID=UPI003B3BA3F4
MGGNGVIQDRGRPGGEFAVRTRAGHTLVVLGWLVVYSLVAAVYASGQMTMGDLIPPAVIVFAFALWGYLRQGGPLVNASSVFCYATALFVAFPAAYAGIVGSTRAEAVGAGWLLVCLSLAVALMAVVLIVSSDAGPPARTTSATMPLPAGARPARRPLISPATGWRLGGALMAAALVLNHVDAAAWLRLPQSLGALSILVLTLALSESVSGATRALLLSGVLVTSALYYEFVFRSFGRLVLGSIVCTMAVIYSARRTNYVPKVILLAGTAPALVYLVQQRLAFVKETWGYQAPPGEGIASVTGPFVSCAQIASAYWDGVISPTFGSTIWATTVFWVPRSIWPGKPVGFGAEIVAITQPGNLDVPEFSDAATIVGELIWNLGLVLIVGGMILLALAIRWLDRRLGAISGPGPAERAATPVRMLALAVVIGGLVNLVWGGVFTFTTRAMGMLVALGLFHLVFSRVRRERSRQ